MNLPVTPSDSVRSPVEWRLKPLTLPTMYDLPHEDPEEPGLPNIYHGLQPYQAEVIAEWAAKETAIAELTQAQQQQQQAIVNFLGLGLSPEQIAIALGVEISIVDAVRNS